jgi:hypothetical protein
MACRDLKKAEVARRDLYKFLDTQLKRHANEADRAEYGNSFRNSLKIEIEHCDLAVVNSVLMCADALRAKCVYFILRPCSLVILALLNLDIHIFLI